MRTVFILNGTFSVFLFSPFSTISSIFCWRLTKNYISTNGSAIEGLWVKRKNTDNTRPVRVGKDCLFRRFSFRRWIRLPWNAVSRKPLIFCAKQRAKGSKNKECRYKKRVRKGNEQDSFPLPSERKVCLAVCRTKFFLATVSVISLRCLQWQYFSLGGSRNGKTEKTRGSSVQRGCFEGVGYMRLAWREECRKPVPVPRRWRRPLQETQHLN